MEKAILKTLKYGNIFDYPMKAWEIQKWLIGKEAGLRQIEKALRKLYKVSRIKYQGGYYFLSGRKGLVAKRFERQRQSEKYLNTAKWIGKIFKLIPWVLLVGVSGGLAMENARREDDIDLFIVTGRKRLWISRILILGVLEVLGKRRKRGEIGVNAAGKICINMLLDEDSLAQKDKDIYLAHEVLQMRVLWEREGIYSKYLEENFWAFKYLPNWVGLNFTPGPVRGQPQKMDYVGRGLTSSFSGAPRPLSPLVNKLFDLLEKLVGWWQLKYMGKPVGDERVMEGGLYFHPQDKRKKILAALDKER